MASSTRIQVARDSRGLPTRLLKVRIASLTEWREAYPGNWIPEYQAQLDGMRDELLDRRR